MGNVDSRGRAVKPVDVDWTLQSWEVAVAALEDRGIEVTNGERSGVVGARGRRGGIGVRGVLIGRKEWRSLRGEVTCTNA